MDKDFPLTVTVPAGTAIASPVVTPYPHDTGHLTSVEIEIPPGHSGLTGIQVLLAGVEIAPWGYGQWYVGDGRIITVPFNDDVNADQLTVAAYNLDFFPHAFHLRAIIAAPQQSPPIDTGAASPLTSTGTPVVGFEAISSVQGAAPLPPDAVSGPGVSATVSPGPLTMRQG